MKRHEPIGCEKPSNFFEVSVSASSYTNNVALFGYYQYDGDPCTTAYVAFTDTNLALSGDLMFAGNMSGVARFPTIRFSGARGLGDYVGTLEQGLPEGYLFGTWSEPVETEAECVPCLNDTYSLRVVGTQILPIVP